MKSNSQPPFPNQLLSADFKLSFILPIKPKHFPFLRMEDGFHFLQKLKGQTKVTRLERWKIRHFQIPFFLQFLQCCWGFFFRHFECRKVFPNHSVENFSFLSFSNFSKSNPRSITIRQSLPLKTKIQFYQNFLPAKRSANHSMFFRRL